MIFEPNHFFSDRPLTITLQRVFCNTTDQRAADDLLFLERWEIHPVPGSAAALRVSQIRRANPELAEAIRCELTAPRRKKEVSFVAQ